MLLLGLIHILMNIERKRCNMINEDLYSHNHIDREYSLHVAYVCFMAKQVWRDLVNLKFFNTSFSILFDKLIKWNLKTMLAITKLPIGKLFPLL